MTRPIRVFHLIKGLGRGGAEMLLAEGPRSSDPTRFRYGIGYFLPHKNALVPSMEPHFDAVTCFRATNAAMILARSGSVAAHVRAFDADVIHCHMPLASVAGRLAGVLARVPVISTEHNLLERYHPWTRRLTLATWRMQRRVIAVSGEVRDSILRWARGAIPVDVVRNGVSLERFRRDEASRARVRADLGIAPETPTVGTVAVFRSQKRLDLWLEAAAALSKVVPSVRFLIVGDGPLRPEVEQNVARHGLRSRVILPGLQEDVRPYLCAMDVLFIASDFEGLPVALLEAMATEVVPVVTDVGGMPEVVGRGAGLVVPKRDVAAMIDGVKRLLEMAPTERRRLGAAARQVVAEHFSVRRMMEELERIYEEVVDRA